MTPLVQHLSPISTSGFLSVCFLVIRVISTAVRDAKMNIKLCITKHTRGINWKMKVWIQIQKPKEEAKFHKGRGSSEGCYSTWPQVDIRLQKFITIALQLISWGLWEAKRGSVTYSYSPRV